MNWRADLRQLCRAMGLAALLATMSLSTISKGVAQSQDVVDAVVQQLLVYDQQLFRATRCPGACENARLLDLRPVYTYFITATAADTREKAAWLNTRLLDFATKPLSGLVVLRPARSADDADLVFRLVPSSSISGNVFHSCESGVRLAGNLVSGATTDLPIIDGLDATQDASFQYCVHVALNAIFDFPEAQTTLDSTRLAGNPLSAIYWSALWRLRGQADRSPAAFERAFAAEMLIRGDALGR